MPAKVYGYAENEADVEALRPFADVDIILEDMAERYQQGEKGGGEGCLL